MKIGIIGSGKFGLVLASIAMQNNNEVVIFSRRKQEVDSINANKKSLSGISLEGSNCFATNNHEDLNSCDALLFTVASKDFRSTIDQIQHSSKEGKFVSCIKGFDQSTGKLMTEVLVDEYAFSPKDVLVLSGPNLSKELYNKELTGTVIAGNDRDFIDSLSNALKTDFFIPFSSSDRYGVELGGAMKNIYAILSGYFHQKDVGENTIGLLLTRCLAEMSVYGKARGANPETFLGLSGVGDFFSTALSKDSRNYKFGTYLADGFSPEEALIKVGDTVEGFATSKIVHKNAKDLGIDLKLLDYLMSIYEGPKSLMEDKSIFNASEIESDSNFKLK
ncbi:MAG: NAD(P)H-dependent glycerol-3-phosphate dehydrogenase [Gammaproteobacteria bacterium]|tara:strand:- start:396 stop:1394 length:999 start_codon:yes stop_codon:yes gene_type:complete